jgi:SAM-dependent methyltransferase
VTTRTLPVSLLRCPACGGPVDDAATCAGCGVVPGLDDGLVDFLSQGERALEGRQDVPEPKVNAFYEARPFPGYNPGDDGSTLIDRCLRSPFLRALDQAVPPDATLLDAGCGTGQIPAFMALSSAARTVVGVDACRASLGAALAFRERAKIPNLHLVRGNLLSMPVPEGVFDVVNCRGVVHHNQDWQLATRRVARHVRPGGVLVLGFYESIARLPHRMRRGVAKLLRRYRPLALFDPILRRGDLDEEKKITWIEDQYYHPLEWCPAFPAVLKLLEEEGFGWVRSVPPVPGREGLFDGDARPSNTSLLSRRIGWALAGADEDAGLVCLVARRRG